MTSLRFTARLKVYPSPLAVRFESAVWLKLARMLSKSTNSRCFAVMGGDKRVLHLFLLLVVLLVVIVTASILVVLFHRLGIALLVLGRKRLILLLGLGVHSVPLLGGNLRNGRHLRLVALQVHADDLRASLIHEEEVRRQVPLRLVRILLLLALLALLLRGLACLGGHIRLHLLLMAELVLLGLLVPLLLVCIGHSLPDFPASLTNLRHLFGTSAELPGDDFLATTFVKPDHVRTHGLLRLDVRHLARNALHRRRWSRLRGLRGSDGCLGSRRRLRRLCRHQEMSTQTQTL